MPSFPTVLRTALRTAATASIVAAGCASAQAEGPTAVGGSARTAGWDWLAKTNEIQTEGVVWNDRFGDGKDRWKTGGLTQSYVFPEHIFSDQNWFEDRASALELNVRALLMTPDNTAYEGVNSNDRPYAQYAAAGIYLRSTARPDLLSPTLSVQEEARIGVEVGWQGDPLPLFELQNGVHDATWMAGDAASLANIIGSEMLVNVEGRHTWRYHLDRHGARWPDLGGRPGDRCGDGRRLDAAARLQLDRVLRRRCRLCRRGCLPRRRLRGRRAERAAPRDRRAAAHRAASGIRQGRNRVLAELAEPGIQRPIGRSADRSRAVEVPFVSPEYVW